MMFDDLVKRLPLQSTQWKFISEHDVTQIFLFKLNSRYIRSVANYR